jgi:hypothetical protein
VACEQALSNLMELGRSVISDVDYLHSWTLRMVEKVMVQGLATPESGRCDGRLNRTPNSERVLFIGTPFSNLYTVTHPRGFAKLGPGDSLGEEVIFPLGEADRDIAEATDTICALASAYAHRKYSAHDGA